MYHNSKPLKPNTVLLGTHTHPLSLLMKDVEAALSFTRLTAKPTIIGDNWRTQANNKGEGDHANPALQGHLAHYS